MKPVKTLFVILMLAAWAVPAAAGCIANGKRYATGTVLGAYQCQPNGQWKRMGRR